jgi:hypothetical protein
LTTAKRQLQASTGERKHINIEEIKKPKTKMKRNKNIIIKNCISQEHY